VFAEAYITKNTPDDMFDLVCAAEVIEHTTNPVEFLRGLAKKLNDNGFLLVSTELFDIGSIGNPSQWRYLAADYGQHITFLSPAGLRLAAGSAGLNWWGSFSFVGLKCIHLLSPLPISPFSFRLLDFRHRAGEFIQRFGLVV
jgi:hypothetical protein